MSDGLSVDLMDVLSASDAATAQGLAGRANEEHALVRRSLEDSLRHAIACGDLLRQAQEVVPHGMWAAWAAKELNIGRGTMTSYTRLSIHREHVLIEGGPQSVGGALAHLRMLDVERRPSGKPMSFDVAEAKRLRAQGLTLKAVGELLGVAVPTLHAHVSPKGQRYKVRMRAAQREKAKQVREALKRRERDDLAKLRGGSPADTYALIRKALLKATVAIGSTENLEERRELDSAISSLTHAENAIVRAMQASRRSW